MKFLRVKENTIKINDNKTVVESNATIFEFIIFPVVVGNTKSAFKETNVELVNYRGTVPKIWIMHVSFTNTILQKTQKFGKSCLDLLSISVCFCRIFSHGYLGQANRHSFPERNYQVRPWQL